MILNLYISKGKSQTYKNTLRTPSKATFIKILNDLLLIFFNMSPEADQLSINLNETDMFFLFKRLGKKFKIWCWYLGYKISELRDDTFTNMTTYGNWYVATHLLHWLAKGV